LVDTTKLNSNRTLFWRPSYLEEVQHILSHFAPLGIKNVGIVYQDGASSQEAFNSLSSELRERGLNLSGTVRLGNNEKLNEQEISRLAATQPGFVIVIADTINSALFLKEFRKFASKTYVAGTSLINLETLREVAGARAVEWTVFSQVVSNPNTGKTPIQLEHLTMMKKYRDEPPSSLTLEGFVVAKVLTKAIQRSKRPTRAALQNLMAQDTNIELGGLSVSSSSKSKHLSGYVDIALFKKNGLVF
jgi:branched-chain amino acid transport system substrate-binding protein